MRSNDKYRNTPLQANSKAHHYPSKLIKQLMNSDSQSQHDDTPLFHDKSKQTKQKAIVQSEKIKISSIAKSINYTGDYDKNLELPPPLTTVSSINRQQLYEREKENINIQSNHAQLQAGSNNRIQFNKQIMYSCFRVQGNKIVDAGMYNSINLEDTSAIKDNNELFLVQIDKLKDDKKECMKRIIQLQQQNKSLQQRLNLVKQELQTKDMYYEEVDRKMGKKQQQVEALTIKILSLQSQINLINKKKAQESAETKNHSRVPQLSRFLAEGTNKSKYQTGAQKKPHSNQDESLDGNVDKIYAELTQYIVTKVEQFKYKLLGNRMSKTVQDIIQEFMAQIVNINPIAVSRSSKKRSCTPVRSYRNINQESWLKNRSNVFEKEQKREVTPMKEKQRSDLRNLEKSLQKLRQMEKSYLSTSNIGNSSMVSNLQNTNANNHASNNSNANSNTYLNGIKQSYNSLDRSSIADVSRSKSRRKRIFQ